MAPGFTFAHELPFSTAEGEASNRALLRQIPQSPGLLALFGPLDASGLTAQPFLTRTSNLRRRAERLLLPPPAREQATTPDGAALPTRRLSLRDRVSTVRYTPTGSDWESLLTLYHATAALLGLPEARRRLRLHTPFFVRFAATNQHPRVYVSNRLARASLAHTFGPFPSRLAAERYTDAILDLFKLRRCYEDLVVHPDHPGCAYGEMKKCLAPCNLSCSPADYAAEAAAVLRFLETNGADALATAVAARDQASTDMDFERAADLHRQHEKLREATTLADPLIRPIPQLRALIIQPATPTQTPPSRLEQSAAEEPASPTAAPTRSSLPERTEAPGEVPSLRWKGETEAASLPIPPEPTNPQPAPAHPYNLEPTTNNPETAALFLLHAGELTASARLSTLGVRAVREQTAVGSSLFAQPLMLAPVPLAPDSALPNQPQPDPAETSPEIPEARAKQALATLENTPLSGDPALLSDHLALLRRWYFRPEKQRHGELLLPNLDGSWPIRRILNAAARAVLGDPKTAAPVSREAAKQLKTKTLHAGREGVERTVPVAPRAPKDTAYRSRRSPAPTDKLAEP